jgi:ribosome-associated protein
MALSQLAKEITKALYIPKKRMKTKISKGAKESRLFEKKHRSLIKKMRGKKSYEE